MLHGVEREKSLLVIDPIKDTEVPHSVFMEADKVLGHIPERLAEAFRMSGEAGNLLLDAAGYRWIQALEVTLKGRCCFDPIGLGHGFRR
jgi:hypothetical protein